MDRLKSDSINHFLISKGMLRNIKIVRAVSIIVLLICALISMWLTIYAGRHNNSSLLVTMFALWVIFPFVILLIEFLISKSWTGRKQRLLYSLMIIISLLSLLVYSNILSPAGTKTAFVFLAFPLLSLLVILALTPVFSLLIKKLKRQNKKSDV